MGRAAQKLCEGTALLKDDADNITPKFVLLSAAAVSRPAWDRETMNAYEVRCTQLP